MTWAEIKQAIQEAGIGETDEILIIQCENLDGDKTLHRTRLGHKLKLSEHTADHKQDEDARGCAV